jgi:hypothetical protein
MSSTCQNEDESHFYITVKNQSDSDVYLARKGIYPYYEKCFMDTITNLTKHSSFEFQPYNISIERVLGRGSKTVLELYFVNPNHFNKPDEFYDCDSIPIKNDILRHYKLTLEDLQRMNWRITYPR